MFQNWSLPVILHQNWSLPLNLHQCIEPAIYQWGWVSGFREPGARGLFQAGRTDPPSPPNRASAIIWCVTTTWCDQLVINVNKPWPTIITQSVLNIYVFIFSIEPLTGVISITLLGQGRHRSWLRWKGMNQGMFTCIFNTAQINYLIIDGGTIALWWKSCLDSKYPDI